MSHRTQIDTFWLLVAILLLALGTIFFGWRAMLSVSAAWLATLATYLIAAMGLQIFWPKRLPDSSLHVLTMGLLLGLSLPVMRQPWIPILAGVMLGLLCHIIGRSHTIRIHPVAAALVLVWVIPLFISHGREGNASRELTTEPAVLNLDHVILGDLYNTPSTPTPLAVWWEDASTGRSHAQRKPEPIRILLKQNIPQNPALLPDLLSSNRLPRVEEMLIGCVPGPIGATSKAVIIVLGLYLMYRRLSWWPMAAGGVLAAVAMLFVMPLYVGQHLTILSVRLWDMGFALAFVYVGYFLLAGPFLWILLILAPSTAPMSARGKIYYGLVIGAGVTLAMWITGSWSSAYIALLVASAFTRPLDALQRSPMLEGR